MKLAAGLLLFALSSPSFAEGFIVGPRFGHQNLKAHSKGTESYDYYPAMKDRGPIVIVPYSEKSEDSTTAFFNTTVEGFRFGYDMDSLVLISDWDFARHYTTGAQLDMLSLSLGAQFPILQTEMFKFYTQLGMSHRRLRFRLYEHSYDLDFGSKAASGDTSIAAVNGINYDFGLGMAMPLMESMSLVVEGKYSDTLAKGTLQIKTTQRFSNETDSVEFQSNAKSRNYSFTIQEFTVGLRLSL